MLVAAQQSPGRTALMRGALMPLAYASHDDGPRREVAKRKCFATS